MAEFENIDEIGPWSEIKLEIIQKYASAYSVILSKKDILSHAYIDAFSGPGFHLSKTDKDRFIQGSPWIALETEPRFDDYYFIDMDSDKTDILEDLAQNHDRVHISNGDCNDLLINDIFPEVQYEDYRRALCLLDPYGLNLNWEVISQAGQMRSVEIFLNFPTMDMNRNVFRQYPEMVSQHNINRMNAFWGDESWRDIVYSESQQTDLFDNNTIEKVSDNDIVARAFQDRLKNKAGFQHVPSPLPLKNSTGATLYYLFFASQRPVAKKIVEDIFSKYRGAM
ncbi:MAG: three-Cys-motif partner protein TcmP [Gemmatimonadetes bacterium]|nr:three-Cys-motif partner protein TcmP [Gemmatimonadota bacterium]MYK53852.1 three-Cys-motif partner protein TcmP [Gemmatimonadota bacterium]